MPKSPQSVGKWGVRPKLDTPHTKNVNVSTQNTNEPETMRSALTLIANTFPLGRRVGGAVSSP